jgi:hypothetical protein
MPAVQQAREAARRTQCRSNLHQIGVALHNYEATYSIFPLTAGVAYGQPNGAPSMPLGFSAQAYLLPFLDQAALYGSINFSDTTVDTVVRDTYETVPHPMNRTALATGVSVYLCPSDPSLFRHANGNNYRTCTGIGPWFLYEPRKTGLFPTGAACRARHVTDGLSHTAAFSEKLRGDGTPLIFTAYAEFFFTNVTDANTPDEVAYACSIGSSTNPPHISTCGHHWLFASNRLTKYNHLFPPNSQVPDCSLDDFGVSGAFAARSLHVAGVNILIGDGAVRFVSDSVGRNSWHALATRDGHELFEGF